MNEIKAKINEELSSVRADERILKNAMLNKNNVKTPMRRPYRIAATAAMLAFVIVGVAFSSHIGGWLNENIRWWYDADTNNQYTLQEIDDVTMQTNANPETNDFTFEFVGADDAVYIDNGEHITIYAQRSVNAKFTLIIPATIMYTPEAFTEIESMSEGTLPEDQIVSSKGFSLVVVDDLSDLEVY